VPLVTRMLVLDLVSLYVCSPAASFITDLTLSTGSLLPTSPTQLTKVNCALCGKVVYMSPEAIQAKESRRLSIIITDSPTTPTTNSIQNSVATPSPQRSISGSWAANKFLKSVTLPSLGGVVAGSTGSRSNSPTPRYSLDSATQNGSGPVTATTATLERPSSPPPPTSLQTVIHAFRVPLSGKSANTSTASLFSIDPSHPSENYGPPYPLCHTGWCLARLKTTCELWGYVRKDVVESVRKDGAVERRQLGGGSSTGVDEIRTGEKPLPPIGGDSNLVPNTGGSITPPSVPPRRKMAELWGMGKDVLDKAKAYGNVHPGLEGAFSSSPASTTGGTSSFFGGVRRSFSSGAVVAGSTTPTEPIRDPSSSENSTIGTDPMGTVKAPPLPKPNTSRLSAVFTGPAETTNHTTKNAVEAREVVGLETEVVEEIRDGSLALPTTKPDETAPAPEATLAASSSVEAFVTPSESPMQELSPNPNADGTKDSTSAEALSTGISDHLSKSGDGVDEEPEPPTPTTNSVGFSTSQPTPPDNAVAESIKASPPARTGHAHNTSIASIISEGHGTKTSRPTTPVKRPGSGSLSSTLQQRLKSGSRPGTPTKATAMSGSRPGTPSKSIAALGSRPSTSSKLPTPSASKPENPSVKAGSISPPPVPRRAAARNAARTSVAVAPKQGEKQVAVTLGDVEEPAGESGDVSKDMGAAEEKANGVQEEKATVLQSTTKEGLEVPPTGHEATAVKEESPKVGDTTIVPSDLPNGTEEATPALDIALPTPSSADKKRNPGRQELAGDRSSVNGASATSTPRSLSVPLPGFEHPSPTSHPVPSLPPSLEGVYANTARVRPPSVVSTSSAYSPSVYMTNSGVNGPISGSAGEANAESEQKNGRRDREFVGRAGLATAGSNSGDHVLGAYGWGLVLMIA
jgi:hypothetical protein